MMYCFVKQLTKKKDKALWLEDTIVRCSYHEKPLALFKQDSLALLNEVVQY